MGDDNRAGIKEPNAFMNAAAFYDNASMFKCPYLTRIPSKRLNQRGAFWDSQWLDLALTTESVIRPGVACAVPVSK